MTSPLLQTSLLLSDFRNPTTMELIACLRPDLISPPSCMDLMLTKNATQAIQSHARCNWGTGIQVLAISDKGRFIAVAAGGSNAATITVFQSSNLNDGTSFHSEFETLACAFSSGCDSIVQMGVTEDGALYSIGHGHAVHWVPSSYSTATDVTEAASASAYHAFPILGKGFVEVAKVRWSNLVVHSAAAPSSLPLDPSGWGEILSCLVKSDDGSGKSSWNRAYVPS